MFQFPLNISEVPLLALLSEGLALFVYTYLVSRVLPRWREKRKRASLNLLLSFIFYMVACLCLFATKTSDFLTGDLTNVATLGINLGYFFSVIGNVFLYYFTENIFYEEPKPYLREFITFGNGITAGFLLIFIVQVQAPPYLEIPGQYIPPHLLIWHVMVSSIGFFILMYKAFKERSASLDKVSKASFLMIGLSGLFELLVFIFFFADRFLGGGYTFWYFLAWLSASFAGFCSMTGFLRPEWLKRLILGKTASAIQQEQ